MLAMAAYRQQVAISYLGTSISSAGQFFIAMAGYAGFLFLAAREIAYIDKFKRISRLLSVYCLLALLVPLLPFNLGDVFFNLHMLVAGIMIACNLCLGVWLCLILRKPFGYLVCSLQAAGLLMLFFTFNLNASSILWRLQFTYELVLIGSLYILLELAARDRNN